MWNKTKIDDLHTCGGTQLPLRTLLSSKISSVDDAPAYPASVIPSQPRVTLAWQTTDVSGGFKQTESGTSSCFFFPYLVLLQHWIWALASSRAPKAAKPQTWKFGLVLLLKRGLLPSDRTFFLQNCFLRPRCMCKLSIPFIFLELLWISRSSEKMSFEK